MNSNLTFLIGWVSGWFEILRVKLISTQVEVEVTVGVELGNTVRLLFIVLNFESSKAQT